MHGQIQVEIDLWAWTGYNLLIISCVIGSRSLAVLLEARADPNARDEFSTAFKTAQKKHMRSIDGLYIFSTNYVIST